MKKFAVVVLAIALLMMFAVLPVMAQNSKWIPVVITRTGTSGATGTRWYTEGDTYHLRDSTTAFAGYTITGTGVSYAGSSSGTYQGNLNLKTGKGMTTFHSKIMLDGGTFEGIIHITGTFVVLPETYPVVGLRGYMLPVNAIFNGQWSGTGDYVGEKLVLEYTIVNGVQPSTLNGYLFRP